MYSSLRSATHHIFFPPRPEVVVLQQDANRLPSHARRKSSLERLLRHQSHGPARVTFRWIAAYHRDDALFLTGVQDLGRAGALLFEKRRIQTALPVTTADIADGLGSQWDNAGNPWRAGAFRQLQQRQGAEDDPNLLNAAAQQLGKLSSIL
jgi:hypothetical protein